MRVLVFCVALGVPPAFAAEGDVPVFIPYRVPKIGGKVGETEIRYHGGRVRKVKEGDVANTAVNELSLAERAVEGNYVIDAPGSKHHGRVVNDAEYARLSLLHDSFVKNATPNTLFPAHRTTGGYSPAKVTGLVLWPSARAKDGIRPIDLYVAFADFRRSGGAHGDPVMGAHGFETVEYSKPLGVESVVERPGQLPKVTIAVGGQEPTTYEFEPMTLPKPDQFPEPKDQRFVLDFGKHPYPDHQELRRIADPQLFYRVYVARVEGSDAIIVRPDSLKALEQAQAGQRVKVNYYRVPLRLLRVAPTGKAGENLLREAGMNFVRDQGIVAEQPGEAGMDALFRANRFSGGRLDTIAGGSLLESMTSFGHSLDIEQAMEEERLRRQKPNNPGNTEMGGGGGKNCQDRLGGLPPDGGLPPKPT
jgi:hypothetical protein